MEKTPEWYASLGWMVYEQLRNDEGFLDRNFRGRGRCLSLSHWLKSYLPESWTMLRHYVWENPEGFELRVFQCYPIRMVVKSSVTGLTDRPETRFSVARLIVREEVIWQQINNDVLTEETIMVAIGRSRYQWQEDNG